ncbi:MAG: hypothetical protein KKA19_01480, partial [Candidatus Margulisbacteria bacterium]|nr:hypothetical protein [Candidatus Margulisiibacteriota bacterium]
MIEKTPKVGPEQQPDSQIRPVPASSEIKKSQKNVSLFSTTPVDEIPFMQIAYNGSRSDVKQVAQIHKNEFLTEQFFKKYEKIDKIYSYYKSWISGLNVSSEGMQGSTALSFLTFVKNIGMYYDLFMNEEVVGELSAILLLTLLDNDEPNIAKAMNVFAEIYSVFLKDVTLHQQLQKARINNYKKIDFFAENKEYLKTIANEI